MIQPAQSVCGISQKKLEGPEVTYMKMYREHYYWKLRRTQNIQSEFNNIADLSKKKIPKMNEY